MATPPSTVSNAVVTAASLKRRNEEQMQNMPTRKKLNPDEPPLRISSQTEEVNLDVLRPQHTKLRQVCCNFINTITM